LGVGLTTPHHKKKLVMTILNKPWTWTDSLDERPKRKKMDMRFGTWNARSMYGAGSLRAVVEEISEYKLDLVGVQEVKWVALNQQANIRFSTERGTKIMN
jgi:hypothetical protein